MENVKLPDLSRLKGVKKRLKTLPPQESATDTSNWENRNVSAPVIDTENKKRTIRQMDFILSEEIELLSLKQLQKIEKDRKQKLAK